MFRHRAVSDARRRLPKKLDLSQIQDPLLAQAGFEPTPASPATPPDSAISIDTDTAHFYSKRPRSPTSPTKTCQWTQPADADSEDGEHSCDEDETYFSSEESHLLLHTRVYALAEKYDIPSLKEVARRKFEIAMACHYDSPEFADAVEEVYCSTIDSERGLRDVVLQAFRNHPQLATTRDVFAVIKQTPSLAFELFKIERGIPV